MCRTLVVSLVLAVLSASCGVEDARDDSPVGDAPPESGPRSEQKMIWELEPGECIDLPGNTEDLVVLLEVDVVSCDQPHVAEVVGLVQDPDTVSLPTQHELELRANRACVQPFEQYVGVSSWPSLGSRAHQCLADGRGRPGNCSASSTATSSASPTP